MRTRLFSLLAVTAAAAFALASAEPPAGQPDKGANPGDKGTTPGANPGTAGNKAAAVDGEWTVVSVARDGTALPGGDKLTVSIKDNVVTFGGADADRSKMRALRLDFGAQGMIRISEAGADGKFGTGTGTGTTPGTGANPGANPGGNQPGTNPGTSAGATGMLTGVYVMTPDYLAISVFAPASGTTPGTGTNPGNNPGTNPGKNPNTNPNPGTNPDNKPGTTPPAGTAANPGDNTGGNQPGASQPGTTGSMGPQMRTHMSVILKRGAGARP